MTGDTKPAESRPGMLEGLQALRFAAAFTVFGLHLVYFVPNSQSPLAPYLLKYGHLGVPLFYVLSAFALMHSTRAYASSPSWVLEFYTKRFFRIAPLFYVMCLISVLVSLPQRQISALEVALNITFLNNLVPEYAYSLVMAGWSVSVEVLFYIVFPLVFVFVRSIRAAGMMLIVSIICALALRPVFDGIPLIFETYGHFAWPTNLPYFMFGVLAFLIYDRVAPRRGAREVSIARGLAYNLSFLAAATATVLPLAFFNDELRAWLRADTMFWAAFFAVLCVWLTVRPIRLLGWFPFQFLGERSYSLYLVHVPLIIAAAPMLSLIRGWLAGTIGETGALLSILALGFAGVTMVASLTYAVIERPGMTLGKRFVARLRRLEERRSAPAVIGPG